MDEIDVLAKEMEGKNYLTETHHYVNELNARNDPNKNAYLQTVRKKLEN